LLSKNNTSRADSGFFSTAGGNGIGGRGRGPGPGMSAEAPAATTIEINPAQKYRFNMPTSMQLNAL
jgi:hypothetical protein